MHVFENGLFYLISNEQAHVGDDRAWRKEHFEGTFQQKLYKKKLYSMVQQGIMSKNEVDTIAYYQHTGPHYEVLFTFGNS